MKLVEEGRLKPKCGADFLKELKQL